MKRKQPFLILMVAFLSFALLTPALARPSKATGKHYFSKRQYQKARKVFQQVVKNNPKDGESWFYLGYIVEQQNNRDQAAKYFEKAVNASWLPRKLRRVALWKLILHFKQKQRYALTYKYAKKYLKYYPRDRSVTKIINKISAAKMWTLSEKAEKSYRKAQKALPQDTDKGISLLEKALNHDSGFLAAHYKLGYLYYNTGQKERSYNHFNRVVYKVPFHGKANYYLGLLSEKRGNWGQCQSRLQKASKNLKDNKKLTSEEIPYHYARCSYRKGEYDKAYKYFRKAKQHKKRDPKIHLLLGLVQEKRKKWLSARRYYQQSLRYKTTSEAYYRLFRLSALGKTSGNATTYARKLYSTLPHKKIPLSDLFVLQKAPAIKFNKIPRRYQSALLYHLFSHRKKVKRIPPGLLNQFLQNIYQISWNDKIFKQYDYISKDKLYILAGDYFLSQKNYPSAQKHYKKVYSAKAYYRLAVLESQRHNKEQALKWLRQAINDKTKLAQKAQSDKAFNGFKQNPDFLLLTKQINEEKYRNLTEPKSQPEEKDKQKTTKQQENKKAPQKEQDSSPKDQDPPAQEQDSSPKDQDS